MDGFKSNRGKGMGGQMKRIFLLEDDLSLINGLSFALKKQGYEVAVARTAFDCGQRGNMIWLF